jgi:hypothetical protein
LINPTSNSEITLRSQIPELLPAFRTSRKRRRTKRQRPVVKRAIRTTSKGILALRLPRAKHPTWHSDLAHTVDLEHSAKLGRMKHWHGEEGRSPTRDINTLELISFVPRTGASPLHMYRSGGVGTRSTERLGSRRIQMQRQSVSGEEARAANLKKWEDAKAQKRSRRP